MSENIITVDGRNVEFIPGETILEDEERSYIVIPTIYQINGAEPTGACRVHMLNPKEIVEIVAGSRGTTE